MCNKLVINIFPCVLYGLVSLILICLFELGSPSFFPLLASVLFNACHDHTGIEILGKLAWSITNSALLLSTPSEVYRRMLNILLLPDCELTMIVLDTLYSLSQLGREVAEVIASVRGLIDVLVWLLSFRVENLPTESLARIKLYFIGDSSSLAQYLAEIQGKPTTSSSPTTTTSTTSSPNVAGSGLNVTGGTTLTGKGGVASPLTTNQIRSRPMILTRASSPLTTNQIVSRGAQSVSITSQSLIKGIGKLAMLGSGSLHSILSALSQTNSRNKPNEEFAIEWLVTVLSHPLPLLSFPSLSLPFNPSFQVKTVVRGSSITSPGATSGHVCSVCTALLCKGKERILK